MRSVAIVGRPNVGKSALFNRLAGRMISIVHDQAGVTRDRISATCTSGEAPFEIVDTGGIGMDADPDFAEVTQDMAGIAIESADVLVFVVDGQSGATPVDLELAKKLRRCKQPVILTVNKVDTHVHDNFLSDFASMGFQEMLGVSAAHGRGIAELVEAIEALLPDPVELDSSEIVPKLAFVGRPNVGKSSLLNAIMGDARSIVSDIAGTTRDAVDVLCERDGKKYVLCDTAGIRHRSRHDSSVEVFSVMRSEDTIERADLCFLVIDATVGVTGQDKKIASLIQKDYKATIIVLNKWDLVVEPGKKDATVLKEHTARIREELFFLSYAPIVVLSAKTGENVNRLFTTVEKVRQHAGRRVGTGELNRAFKEIMDHQAPPMKGARRFKLLYVTQVAASERSPFPPPCFILFVNDPSLMPDSYASYLHSRLRERWEYPGLPIVLKQRGREKKEE